MKKKKSYYIIYGIEYFTQDTLPPARFITSKKKLVLTVYGRLKEGVLVKEKLRLIRITNEDQAAYDVISRTVLKMKA